jgi:CubicO group peptidase (beta-lactamase class C family)
LNQTADSIAMKTFLYPILTVFLVGCGATAIDKKAAQAAKKALPVLAFPQFNQLSEAAKERLSKNCAVFYDTIMANQFNGAFLVAKNGTVLLERYEGFENPNNQQKAIDSRSQFHLASVSKTFTAMAILRLWEQGQLKLEDLMEQYFPGFPYPGITVKQLLNHRSGLPNYVYFMEKNGWDSNVFCSNQDVLKMLMTGKPMLNHPPDVHFSYSNTNFALLALIIEKLSGQSYAEFMQQTIFDPLGMASTFVFDLKRDSNTVMMSYDWKNRIYPHRFLDAVVGDKNIYSNVRDLLKWDMALYSDQFLKPATLEAAFTPYSNEKPGVNNYGLGWRMKVLDKNKKIIFHNGWWHGNRVSLIHLYRDSACIISMNNNYSRKAYSGMLLANLFNDYYLGSEEGEEGKE